MSEKTIGRLSIYRRVLERLKREGTPHVHSHQLAVKTGASAAQVRRDVMGLGYEGSPRRGYDVSMLLASLSEFLDGDVPVQLLLVGVGHMGQALLTYFSEGRTRLSFSAAFDTDPQKAGTVIRGCRCYSLQDLEQVMDPNAVKIGVVAVPAATAQEVADRLVDAGVRGLLNFAPIAIQVPPGVYLEDVDLSVALEKVAFFARRPAWKKNEVEQA